MKARSFYSLLLGMVILLLVVAATGFYWLFAQSPLSLLTGGQTATPGAAMFVPKQAPVMVSLLVNPEQLEAFRLVVAPAAERRRARAELNQFKQSLLASTGLDYGRDVQPWLGQELTLAITTLDIDRDLTNGKQPGYLLAVATKDPQQSREFLQLFWQKRAIAGTDLMFEQYKGVKLIYGSTAETTPDTVSSRKSSVAKRKDPLPPSPASLLTTNSLATAVVGDRFVLVANHPKVLRDAINNVQVPDLNLSNTDFYTQALESLTQPRIGLSFVNLPGAAEWLSGETSNQGKNLSKPPVSSPTYRTLAVALELDRHGFLAETALLGDRTITVPASLSQPVGALRYIPGDSSIAASGINLNRLWSGLATDVKGYETIAQLLNQPLRDLQNRWQIDLSRDIFSWVTGEYALGMLPVTNGQIVPGAGNKGKNKVQNAKSKPLAGDWVFVAQRPSEDSTRQAIAHLDEIARKQGLSTGPVNLENQTVSAWTRLKTASGKKDAAPVGVQADVRGVHATIGSYEIFATSIAAMDRALKAGDAALPTRTQFQQAIAPFQQPNNGYLYLDWGTAQPLLEQHIPLLKVIELAGKPLLEHLRSLTVSSFGSQAGVQRGGIFINLS